MGVDTSEVFGGVVVAVRGGATGLAGGTVVWEGTVRFIRFEAHVMPETKVWVVGVHTCEWKLHTNQVERHEFHVDGISFYTEQLACGCRPQVPEAMWLQFQRMSELERAVFVVRHTQGEEVTHG